MSKIQVNEIVNHFDTGAPDCPKGLTVTGFSTFSGGVSIGGTLTYEDVTNIDSVGIITANAGIDISNTIVANNDSTIRYDNDTFHVKVDTNNVRGSSTFKLDIDDTNAITIDDNRRIGIGTDNPTVLLDLESTSPTIRLTDSDASGTPECQISGAGGDLILDADRDNQKSDSLIRFQVDGSEKVRIDTNGNLLVNKTSTDLSSAGHEIRTGTAGQHIMGKSLSGTVNGIYFHHNSSYVGGLNYTNSATSIATSSDYRLKENVVNIPNAIEKAKQLNPVQFNFISDPDETITGFIAHEVGEVVPEACFGEKDAVDEDGAIRPQSVSKANLVPLLAAALKEAISEIETLKTKVAALEGN